MSKFSMSELPATMPDNGKTKPAKSRRMRTASALMIAAAAVVAIFAAVGWRSAPQAEALEAKAESADVVAVETKAPRIAEPEEQAVETASALPLAEPSMVTAAPVDIASPVVPDAAPIPERFGSVTPPEPLPEQQVAVVEPDPLPVENVEPVAAAAIEMSPAAEPVTIADTEAEILAAEKELAIEGNAYFQLPEEDEKAPFDTVLNSEAVPLPSAWTKTWVNMRDSPDNGARTLAIVPAGTAISAEESCVHWCRVVHDGQQGFIYKSFIKRTR